MSLREHDGRASCCAKRFTATTLLDYKFVSLIINAIRNCDLLMLGFLKVNRALNLSSTQSISLPITFRRAFESINTFTPSCSTCSSNLPGLSTYSKWYAEPEQPLFFTPIRISFGSGESSNSRRCSTAVGVSVMAALRGLNFIRVGLAGFVVCSDGTSCNTGFGFCASCSAMLNGGVFWLACILFSDRGNHGDELFQLEAPPVIDVSGTPAFRGGGGPGSSVVGRYALSVMSWRFEDWKKPFDEEKVRRHRGHRREHLVDEEATRRREVKHAVRGAAIVVATQC